MNPSASSPILSMLREATAQSHQQIESVLGDHAQWSLAHYKQVLIGFEHFWRGWEPLVLNQLALLDERDVSVWFQSRSRWTMVRQDLDALGCQPRRSNDIDWLPLKQALDSKAAVWGSIYVLEGSNLGGQVIARHARQNLGLDAQKGVAYFNAWGARTGAMWQAFRKLLSEDDAWASPSGAEAACKAAVATFNTLIHSFQSLSLHEPVTT